jgi:cysteine-rich repeat protein
MVNNQCFGGAPSEPSLQLRGADGFPIAFTGPPDPITGCTTLDPRIDRAVAGLAAGTYFVAVVAPPFSDVPQYELYLEIIPPACGNFIPEAPEQCEDGNTIPGDGCSASCALEIAAVLMPPGGTVTASVPPSFGAFLVVQVELTMPGQSISATVRDQNGNCPPDFELAFVNTATQEFVPVPAGFCEILFPIDRFAVGLPVGTYWIIALPNQRMALGGDYTVSVLVHDPVCGDSVLQAAANEECDDGNMVDGDGCTTDCQIEFLGQVAVPAGSPAVFADAIVPANQVDFYEITVTSSTALYLTIETFVPDVAGGCIGNGQPGMPGNDTVIRLFDANGGLIAENDQAEPTSNCSRLLGVRVTQGTYVLHVISYQALGEIPAYEVRIESSPADICGNGLLEPGETCDDGNTTSGDGCSAACEYEGVLVVESEQNGTQASADPLGLTGARTVHVKGTNTPPGDNDVYSFAVPANAAVTVHALTHTDPINPTSCKNAMTDTTLYVEAAGIEVVGWGPNLGQLEWNDDAGPGFFCSEIDFALPVSSTEQTYYLRVQGFQNTTVTEYYLDVTLQ